LQINVWKRGEKVVCVICLLRTQVKINNGNKSDK
jgi:hypothetical protein